MIQVPSKSDKKWVSDNQGDIFGNIIRTRNLDFNKKGYLSLSGKPKVLYSEIDSANFQTPVVIEGNDFLYYIVTTGHCYSINFSTFISVSDLTAGSPPTFSGGSDAVYYNGAELHVSGTTMVCSWNGTTWTSRITGLSSSYPHPLCVSEHQQYLAVGDGNTVKLYDTSYTLQATCTIPNNQIVTWIRWKGNLLYFGTRNIYGGEAKMYLWDGSGTAAQSGYGVGSEWAMSGCVYEDTMVIASLSGQLLRFTGNGFTSLKTDDGREANFPIYYSRVPWGSDASNVSLLAKIASRGMAVKGRRIFMVVDSTNGSETYYSLNFPAGLWVFDPSVGLYHKSGIDHKTQSTVNPNGLSSNTLSFASAQVFETGDPIICDLKTGLTGVISGTLYYAIKVDSTHLKLAYTSQQALDGEAITLGGTPGVLDFFTFNKYQSVGATKIEKAGPVKLITRISVPEFHGEEVIFASETNNSTSSTIGVVMTIGMGKNVGSFMLPRIEASAVKDLFQKIIAKFQPMYIPSRKIIVKYRVERRVGVPGRMSALSNSASSSYAVWVDSTHFTINPTSYDTYQMAVGDEIEFIEGAAAGYTVHIASITKTSSTSWSIEIDEAMPDVSASDTSQFFFDNFTKYATISTADDAQAAATGLKKMTITKRAKWIQLKFELRGYTDVDSFYGRDSLDIEEVALINKDDLKYN